MAKVIDVPLSDDATVDQWVRLFMVIQNTTKFGPRNQHAGLLELTSVKLSCTSPELLGPLWTPKGDLLPSSLTKTWVAAHNSYGASWVLAVYIKPNTMKSILKLSQAKKNGRLLTFSPECVSMKTVGGHFLSGSTASIRPAKRQRTERRFDRDHQSFLDLGIAGNSHGTNKIANFMTNLRAAFAILFKRDSRLVVLAYPGRTNNSKFKPIQYDASPMSSQARVRHMVKKLWIKEGDDDDHDVVDFNSIEY